MKKEFTNVKIDFSRGSAYEYKHDSQIPTEINFGRYFNGKFQKYSFHGVFNNDELHSTVFLIKRGYDIIDIQRHIKSFQP